MPAVGSAVRFLRRAPRSMMMAPPPVRFRNHPSMKRPLAVVVWTSVALLGAAAFAVLALHRGETVNAAWLVIAAVCTYAVAYRFYSRFIATRVLGLDDSRATPAERLD